jgi:hypothetical protein
VTWIHLRSRRDPAVWLPALLVILLLTAIAAWAHVWMSAWLEAVNETASSDPERAVAEAVQMIRLCEVALCAASVLFGTFLYRFFQLGLREGRLPPSGWWSLGAWRAAVGARALRMSRLGLALALLLPISTAVTVLLIECLLRALLHGELSAR